MQQQRDLAVGLAAAMDIDHPVQVHPDGTVTDAPDGVHAPEVYDQEQASEPMVEPGWSLLNGYSGQYGYAGPVMHPSEYIGGQMVQDILAEPGIYVAVVVTDIDTGEDVGWAVARKRP